MAPGRVTLRVPQLAPAETLPWSPRRMRARTAAGIAAIGKGREGKVGFVWIGCCCRYHQDGHPMEGADALRWRRDVVGRLRRVAASSSSRTAANLASSISTSALTKSIIVGVALNHSP